MTELKTLKDISKEAINDIQFIYALRQEAIKYIKKLREDQFKLPKHPRQKDWKRASLMIEAQIGWITYFFSITEEELK